MRQFMSRYLLGQVNVPRNKMLSNLDNYNKIIDFCLKTRRFPNNKSLSNAKRHFTINYPAITQLIKDKDIKALRSIIHEAEGVGQKVGSFILEVFIHYGLNDKVFSRELYVPLDSHVLRVLSDAFGMNIKNHQLNLDNENFINFQSVLKQNAVDGRAIIFDYLWFVGKVFHPELKRVIGKFSRGYRLCSICWIKDVCRDKNKW